MEINRINTTNSAPDMAREFAPQKPASADSGGSSEKHAVDIARLDNEITSTDSKLTAEFLQKTISRANKQLDNTNREFDYSIHEKTGQFVVKVINSETKEVIREIPSEKTLDAVARMWDLMGVFVDEKT